MHTFLKVALILVLLTAATWRTYTLHGSPDVGIDDANIFMGYAENLVSGRGITYGNNPERVEGVTSIMWMLVCAGVFRAGGSERGILIVSVLMLALTQWILLRSISRSAAQRAHRAWPYEIAAMMLVMSSPAYVTWMTVTLMDTCMWGLFVAAMTHAAIWPPETRGERILWALPFILAPLVRPEAMVLAPGILALMWVRAWARGSDHWRSYCVLTGLAMVMVVMALTIFRILYFGYPLPNTYYAKVSPSLLYSLREGIVYSYRFATSGALAGGLVGLTGVVSGRCIGRLIGAAPQGCEMEASVVRRLGGSETASLVAMLLLLLPVLTGGDHFGLFRFYQPAYPIMCLTLVLLITERSGWDFGNVDDRRGLGAGKLAAGAATLMVIASMLYTLAFTRSWSSIGRISPLRHEFPLAEEGLARGTEIMNFFGKADRLPTVGVMTAGGIGRTYRGPIMDLMGLNNTRIAHFRGDRHGMKNHAAFEKDVFFEVEPDMLLALPPDPPGTANQDSVWLKGLFDDPRFVARWSYGTLHSIQRPGRSETAFFSKTYLASLRGKGEVEFEPTMTWKMHWVPLANHGEVR